ncbi:hypothetical protein FRC0449_01478 [Corynebacterium diphtheriae]|nr:hypothetical protein FRC0449_01478 [Corynebacterium diphtheriae]
MFLAVLWGDFVFCDALLRHKSHEKKDLKIYP